MHKILQVLAPKRTFKETSPNRRVLFPHKFPSQNTIKGVISTKKSIVFLPETVLQLAFVFSSVSGTTPVTAVLHFCSANWAGPEDKAYLPAHVAPCIRRCLPTPWLRLPRQSTIAAIATIAASTIATSACTIATSTCTIATSTCTIGSCGATIATSTCSATIAIVAFRLSAGTPLYPTLFE